MQEYDVTIRTTSNDGADACYGARLISVRPSGSMREHSTMLASSYLLALEAHNVLTIGVDDASPVPKAFRSSNARHSSRHPKTAINI